MLRFDPTELRKYGGLTLLARQVVEGFLTGVHRSPYKGFSVEFAEHRQYTPGDEIRHIDWRAFGKTDRYYVKEYEEETNLKAYLSSTHPAAWTIAGQEVAEQVRVRPARGRVARVLDAPSDGCRRTDHARHENPRH